MAASYEHGVDTDAVLELYPRGRASDVTETSNGVNLPMIRTLISQGSAIVNTALQQHGYSDIENQLEADAAMLVQQAIIDYCVGQLLRRVGSQDEADAYMTSWTDSLNILRKMPEYLGSSQPSGSTVHSNVNTNRTITKSYGRNFKGW
jgi:hypothetical protein